MGIKWIWYKCPTCGAKTKQRADFGIIKCMLRGEHKDKRYRTMKPV